MVTEKNRAYALGDMLGMNQTKVRAEAEQETYGLSPGGIVGEGGLGIVARQAVFVEP